MKRKKKQNKIVGKRRTLKDDLLSHPEWRKQVLSIRLSEKSIEVADDLADRFPGFYYNRSHVIECAIARLRVAHDRGEIKMMV